MIYVTRTIPRRRTVAAADFLYNIIDRLLREAKNNTECTKERFCTNNKDDTDITDLNPQHHRQHLGHTRNNRAPVTRCLYYYIYVRLCVR